MRLRNLYEDTLSTIVFTFGRFNPPTIGHEILINKVKSVAEQYGADYIIFASQSQDKKKNPLTFIEKVFFMEKMFPGTNFNKDLSLKTPFQALEALGQKYDRAVLVVGSDRVPEFKSRMAPYVEEFGYKDLIVVSAGERDPDADGAEGMSASKARELAMSGDVDQFKTAIPSDDKLATMMYNKVRAGLGVVEKQPAMAESLNEDFEIDKASLAYLQGIDTSSSLWKKSKKGKINSDEIANMQSVLQSLGYKPGKADGWFGKKTARAVMNFQKDYELTVDGDPGKNTIKKMIDVVWSKLDVEPEEGTAENPKKVSRLQVGQLNDFVFNYTPQKEKELKDTHEVVTISDYGNRDNPLLLMPIIPFTTKRPPQNPEGPIYNSQGIPVEQTKTQANKDEFLDKIRAGLKDSVNELNDQSIATVADAEFSKIVATLADAGIPLTKELNQWRREGGMVNVIDNLIPFINKKFDKMQSYDIDRYLKSADYNNKTQAEKKKLLPALLNIKKAQAVIPQITTQLRILQKELETAGITEKVTTALPKKTKIMKMPAPPKAPTADTPDGVDDSGVEISTTQKGNRMVSNGGGDYIFTPKGKLIVFKTPRIGGLVQIHNLQKQTVTVDFDTITNNVSVKQKGTYDMQGNLISADNTSMRSGAVGISQDKDKGDTIDYRLGNDPSTKISANSKTGISVGEEKSSAGPEKIKPLPVPKFPEMPQQAGDLGNGALARQTKLGMTLSNAEGTFLWDASGKPAQWRSPAMGGMTQTHDLKTGTITVRYKNAGLKVTKRFDKNGNSLDAGDAQYGFGDVNKTKNADGSTKEVYTAGVYKLEITKDANGKENETYWKHNSRTDRVKVDASEVPADIIANLNKTRRG